MTALYRQVEIDNLIISGSFVPSERNLGIIRFSDPPLDRARFEIEDITTRDGVSILEFAERFTNLEQLEQEVLEKLREEEKIS